MKRCSKKYAANLYENTNIEVWFQWTCQTALLKSHFSMGLHFSMGVIYLLYILQNASGGLLLCFLLSKCLMVCFPSHRIKRIPTIWIFWRFCQVNLQNPSHHSYHHLPEFQQPLRRYSHTIYFFIEIYDCIHTIFIFQHEKQNEKYTFIPFISRVYYLKWTIKRSNFYEGLTLCRFKYNFDRLERDKSKFDWRKYKIHLDEYVCLPDWECKICRPFRKTNIFVIIGQTFDVEKYAQNHVNSL